MTTFRYVGEEVVGFAEIVRMLEVSRKTTRKYVERDDFPGPIGHLSVGRLWRRADVERWARETLPLRTGRPPRR